MRYTCWVTIECISIFFIALSESVDSPDRAAEVSLRVQKRLETRLCVEGGSNLRPNVIVILMGLAIPAPRVQGMCQFRIVFSKVERR